VQSTPVHQMPVQFETTLDDWLLRVEPDSDTCTEPKPRLVQGGPIAILISCLSRCRFPEA